MNERLIVREGSGSDRDRLFFSVGLVILRGQILEMVPEIALIIHIPHRHITVVALMRGIGFSEIHISARRDHRQYHGDKQDGTCFFHDVSPKNWDESLIHHLD